MDDNRTLYILFASILVDLFGFTTILPIFPSIFAFYEQHDTSNAYATIFSSVRYFRREIIGAPDSISSHSTGGDVISLDSVLLGGLIGSWFSLLQFFTAPIFTTKFSSAKTAIITSLSGSIIASLVWFKSQSFMIFLLARTLGGLFEGNVSISITIIGRFKDEQLRKKGMAMVGIAYSLAFVLGPLVGVWLSKQSVEHQFYQLPAIFTLVCAASSMAIVVWFLDETTDAVKSREASGGGGRNTRRLFIAYFVYLLAFSGVEFSIGFLLLEKWNKSRSDQGKIYSLMGLIMAVMQGGVVRKHASPLLLMKALLGLVCAFYFLGQPSWEKVQCGLFLKSVAAACMVPSFNVTAAAMGVNLGQLRAVGALARAFGPALFCTIYWIHGPMVCFVSGSLVLVLAMVSAKSVCEDAVDREVRNRPKTD